MSGVGARLALVVATLAAGGAGWFGAQQLGEDTPAAGTAVATADFFGCDVTTAPAAAASLGQVHAGDSVWLLGVTGDRWAIIRRPDHPFQPVWLPLAMVTTAADAGDLPDLTCAAAVDAAGTTSTAPVTTAGSVPGGPGTPTTVGLETTTSSSTSTTSSTTTTVLADVIPPTVTVTTDRAHLYVLTDRQPCAAETTLEVSIVVADPSVPLTIRSIVATWTSPAGPQTANLVPVGGTRFSLQITANGPATGETPLTLTATGSDGVGNIGTGQAVVSLRDPASFGCAG